MEQIGTEISNKEYHSTDKMSTSKLTLLHKNALSFYKIYVSKEIEKETTQAMLFGSMLHTLVLENEKYKKEYKVLDLPKIPKKDDYIRAIEELKGEFEDKETIASLKVKLDKLIEQQKQIIITKEQDELVRELANKVLESDFKFNIGNENVFKANFGNTLKLDTCIVERAFYGKINDIEFQIKPDMLVNLGKDIDCWVCVDLKTTHTHVDNNFARSVSTYFYDVQQYIYTEILRQNGIELIDFIFCVAPKKEDEQIINYTINRLDIENAEIITKAFIEKYKYCKDNKIWLQNDFNYDKKEFKEINNVTIPVYRAHNLMSQGIKI